MGPVRRRGARLRPGPTRSPYGAAPGRGGGTAAVLGEREHLERRARARPRGPPGARTVSAVRAAAALNSSRSMPMADAALAAVLTTRSPEPEPRVGHRGRRRAQRSPWSIPDPAARRGPPRAAPAQSRGRSAGSPPSCCSPPVAVSARRRRLARPAARGRRASRARLTVAPARVWGPAVGRGGAASWTDRPRSAWSKPRHSCTVCPAGSGEQVRAAGGPTSVAVTSVYEAGRRAAAQVRPDQHGAGEGRRAARGRPRRSRRRSGALALAGRRRRLASRLATSTGPAPLVKVR